MRKPFVSAYLAGEASLEDIDGWVEEWHSSETGVSLDEFLGFTAEEGSLWAGRPEILPLIVESHRLKGN